MNGPSSDHAGQGHSDNASSQNGGNYRPQRGKKLPRPLIGLEDITYIGPPETRHRHVYPTSAFAGNVAAATPLPPRGVPQPQRANSPTGGTDGDGLTAFPLFRFSSERSRAGFVNATKTVEPSSTTMIASQDHPMAAQTSTSDSATGTNKLGKANAIPAPSRKARPAPASTNMTDQNMDDDNDDDHTPYASTVNYTRDTVEGSIVTTATSAEEASPVPTAAFHATRTTVQTDSLYRCSSDGENDGPKKKKQRTQLRATTDNSSGVTIPPLQEVAMQNRMDRASCTAQEEELLKRLDRSILLAEEEDILRRLELHIQAAEAAEALSVEILPTTTPTEMAGQPGQTALPSPLPERPLGECPPPGLVQTSARPETARDGQAQPLAVSAQEEPPHVATLPTNREEAAPPGQTALPSPLSERPLGESPPTGLISFSSRSEARPSSTHEFQKSVRRIMQDERSVELELLVTVSSKLGAQVHFSKQTGSHGWLYNFKAGSPLHSALGYELRESGVVLVAIDGTQIFSFEDFKKNMASARNGDQYRFSLVCSDGVDLTGIDLSRLAEPPRRRNGEKYPLLDPKDDSTSLRSKRPTSIETRQITLEGELSSSPRSKKPRIEGDCEPPFTSRSSLQTMEQGTPREASLEPDGQWNESLCKSKDTQTLIPLVRGESRRILSWTPPKSNVLAAIPRQDAFNPRKPEPQNASQDSENRPSLAMEMQEGISTRESVSNSVTEKNPPNGVEKMNATTTTFLLPWKLEKLDGLEVLSRERFERDFMTVFRRKLPYKLLTELSTFDVQIGYNREKPFFMEFQASGYKTLVSAFRKQTSAWGSYVGKLAKLDAILKDPDSIVVDITAREDDTLGIKILDAKNVAKEHTVEVRGAVFFELKNPKGLVSQLLGPEVSKAAAAIIAVNGHSSFSNSKEVGRLFAQKWKEQISIVITLCLHKGTRLMNQDSRLVFRRLGETQFFPNWNEVASDVGQGDDTVMEYPPPGFVGSSAVPKLPPETIEEMEEAVNKILNDEKSVEVEFYMPSKAGIGALLDKKARYLHGLRQGGQLATVFGKKPADWFMAVLAVNGVSIRDIDHFIAEKAKPSYQDMFKLRVACFDGVDLSDVDRSRLVGTPRRRNGEKYPMHLPKKNSLDAPIVRKPKRVTASNTEEQNYFMETDGTSSSQLNRVPDIIQENEKPKAPLSRTEISDASALAQVKSQSESFEHPVQNIKKTKIGENLHRVSLSIKRRLKEFRNHVVFDEKTFEADFMDVFREAIQKKFPLIFPSFKYTTKNAFNPNWFEVTATGDHKIINFFTQRINIWACFATKMAMVNLLLRDPQSIVVDVKVPPGLTGIGLIPKDKLQNLSGEQLRRTIGLGIYFTPSYNPDAKNNYGGVSFEISNPPGFIGQTLGDNVCNPVAAIIAADGFPCNHPSDVKKILRFRRDEKAYTVLRICIFRGSGGRLFQNPEVNARRLGGTPFLRSLQTFSNTELNHADAFPAERIVLHNPKKSPAMNFQKEADLGSSETEHSEAPGPRIVSKPNGAKNENLRAPTFAIEGQSIIGGTLGSQAIETQTISCETWGTPTIEKQATSGGTLGFPTIEKQWPSIGAWSPPTIAKQTIGGRTWEPPVLEKRTTCMGSPTNEKQSNSRGTRVSSASTIWPLGGNSISLARTSQIAQLTSASKLKTVTSTKSEVFEYSFDATQPLGAFFVTETVDIFKICKVQSRWVSGQAARNTRIRSGTIVESVKCGSSRQPVRGHRELCKFYEDAAKARSTGFTLVFKNPESISDVDTSIDKDWTFDGKWQGETADGWAGGAELFEKKNSNLFSPSFPWLRRQTSGVNAVPAPAERLRNGSFPLMNNAPVVGDEIAIDTKLGTPGKEKLTRTRSISFGPSTAVIIPALKRDYSSNDVAGPAPASIDLTESFEEEAPPPPTTPLLMLQDAVRNKNCKELIEVLEGGASRDPKVIEKGLRQCYDEVKKLIHETEGSNTLDVIRSSDLAAKKTILNIYLNSVVCLEKVFSLEHLSWFEFRVANMDLRLNDESMTSGHWSVHGRIQVRAGTKNEIVANMKAQKLHNFMIFSENDNPRVKVSNNAHMPMEPRRHLEFDFRKAENYTGGKNTELCRFDISLNEIELICPHYDRTVTLEIPTRANSDIKSGELTIEIKRVRTDKVYVDRKSHEAGDGLVAQLDNISRFNEANHGVRLSANIEGRHGKGMIHAAVYLKRLDLVKKLGSQGAKVVSTDIGESEVESPLTQAQHMRDRATEKLRKLEESGGDPNAVAAQAALCDDFEAIVVSLIEISGDNR